MMDRSVPMIGLAMACDDLHAAPIFELPPQYGVRWFRPGDEYLWVEIERSAGEFENTADAIKKFRNKYFPTDEGLSERMLFLTENGAAFATATAWYGEGMGRLHWVGIDAAHQGRGLSRPLVSLALECLRALGHRSAYLTTQTASWVAIRVYREFGFRPRLRDETERAGWEIVSRKTNMDFMKDLEG